MLILSDEPMQIVAGNLYATASDNRRVRVTYVGIEEVQGTIELDRTDPDNQGEARAWTHAGFRSSYNLVHEGTHQPLDDGTPGTIETDEVRASEMGDVAPPEGTPEEPEAEVESEVADQAEPSTEPTVEPDVPEHGENDTDEESNGDESES